MYTTMLIFLVVNHLNINCYGTPNPVSEQILIGLVYSFMEQIYSGCYKIVRIFITYYINVFEYIKMLIT